MVRFYVRRITDSKLTLEEVPERWHDKVQAELEKTE